MKLRKCYNFGTKNSLRAVTLPAQEVKELCYRLQLKTRDLEFFFRTLKVLKIEYTRRFAEFKSLTARIQVRQSRQIQLQLSKNRDSGFIFAISLFANIFSQIFECTAVEKCVKIRGPRIANDRSRHGTNLVDCRWIEEKGLAWRILVLSLLLGEQEWPQ